MVAIRTGDLKSAKDTSPDRWQQLVHQWQRYSYIEFPDDCSKLKQMRDECEELGMWQALGYESIEEFFSQGLLLDYRAVELACMALEVTDDAVGLDDAVEEGRKLMSRSEAGKMGGRGNKAADNISSFKHGTGKEYLAARIARDFPDLDVSGFKSVRQAAIHCGIVKEASPYQLLVRAWGKASEEERNQFMADYG